MTTAFLLTIISSLRFSILSRLIAKYSRGVWLLLLLRLLLLFQFEPFSLLFE